MPMPLVPVAVNGDLSYIAAIEDSRQIRVKSDPLMLQFLIQCARVRAMIHAKVYNIHSSYKFLRLDSS